LFQIVVLPFEVFDLLAGGISDRIPGETLFTRFHELFGSGIEDARFNPLPPTEVTNRDLPSETLQHDADLVLGHFRLPSRCGRSIPCTGSPNTPPPSCFSPLKVSHYHWTPTELAGSSF